MALPTSYMTGGFNKIPTYFDAILTAKAPEKFTIKFLENLGFTSSNDRLFINVLKNLGLLDEMGVPTNKYYEFMDQSKSKKIIAEGIRDAYADLFQLNKKAQELSKAEVEGKFTTLTSGSKGKRVVSLMASTFKALCEYADWTDSEETAVEDKKELKQEILEEKKTQTKTSERNSDGRVTLNYDIHIHLPATRDAAIYDALFESLTKHISIK